MHGAERYTTDLELLLCEPISVSAVVLDHPCDGRLQGPDSDEDQHNGSNENKAPGGRVPRQGIEAQPLDQGVEVLPSSSLPLNDGGDERGHDADNRHHLP